MAQNLSDTVMRMTTSKSLLQRLLRRGNCKQLRQSQRTMETTSMHFAATTAADPNCHAAAAVRPMPSMLGEDDYANDYYHASSPCRFAATTRSSLSPAIPYEISIPSDSLHTDGDDQYWEQLASLDSSCELSPVETAYGNALDCFDAQEYEQALEQVQIGVTALHEHENDENDDLRCKLLLVQAETLEKLERYAQGLECYQQVLDYCTNKKKHHATSASESLLDCANLYCTCGRVAARAKDYEQSIYYFEQGLALIAASSNSSNAAMAALLYHELALVYRNAYPQLQRRRANADRTAACDSKDRSAGSSASLQLLLVQRSLGAPRGSMIWKDILLTAAHCNGSPWTGDVIVGAYRYKTVSDGAELIGVKGQFLHPKWGGIYNYRYDFMVVALNSKAANINGRTVSKLSSGRPARGEVLTTLGMGTVTEGKPYLFPAVLQEVNVAYVPTSQCARQYGSNFIYGDTMICASSPNKDSCQGDSGGPLLRSNGHQVGIVSWGIGNAMCPMPEKEKKTKKKQKTETWTTDDAGCSKH
ncbi:hypothetical protein MPSEU_000993400 [Mayamaea pseudoterrestris]|nr:hypothetical protein MPSEU_000993400 [Mayamaea pseudoterrestris]